MTVPRDFSDALRDAVDLAGPGTVDAARDKLESAYWELIQTDDLIEFAADHANRELFELDRRDHARSLAAAAVEYLAALKR